MSGWRLKHDRSAVGLGYHAPLVKAEDVALTTVFLKSNGAFNPQVCKNQKLAEKLMFISRETLYSQYVHCSSENYYFNNTAQFHT